MNSRLLLFLTLLLLLGSCKKREVDVDFQIGTITSNYRLQYSYQETLQEQGVPLTEGRYALKIPATEPVLVGVLASGAKPALYFVATPGDKILLKGEKGDPATWTVEGGDTINALWTQWRLENRTILSNPDSLNLAVARFVNAHPSSRLSPFLLLTSYDARRNDMEFQRLWQKLTPEADAPDAVAMTGRTDMLEQKRPSLAQEIRLYRGGDSLSVVKFNRPTLIWVWREQNQEKRAWEDSLLAIVKNKQTLQVVDICFHRDSLSWRHMTGTDTVWPKGERFVRGWVPAAEQTPELTPLAIPRAPYVILLDSGGKHRYRGSDIQALKSKI